MAPSVDSTCTQSPCVTLSTPKKRNTCSSKVLTDDLHKKPRGSSSLSETSPRRPENLDMIGQLTQESQKKKKSSPDIDSYVHVDLPCGRQQVGYVPLPRRKNDGFLKLAKLRKEERRASEDFDGSISSMILHSESLARSILVAYEKERDQANSASSEIIMELEQLRTSKEATDTELIQMRTFHEAATTELAQLRIAYEAAAAEGANLQLENANLAEMEAATFSKLDELRKRCATRDAVSIGAAFIISKALILREKAEYDATVSSEIGQLRFEHGQIIRETREIETKTRAQIFNLQSILAATDEELIKLRSDKADLIKEKDERETRTSSASQDLLSRIAAANDEVKQVRSKTEALLRNKDERAAMAAHAAAVELHKMESRNEALLREMQTAIETTSGEIEEMHSVLESTTANLRKVFLEKENIAREKAESEGLAKLNIAQLLSEKAALVVEKEKTSATVPREFKKLRSRFDAVVEKLKTVRQETGLEKSKLQSDVAAKKSELVELKKKLSEAQTHMAVSSAMVHKLSREKEESYAREAVLSEKLQTMRVLPTAHSEMHLAFLINCGVLQPEDYNLSFLSRSYP